MVKVTSETVSVRFRDLSSGRMVEQTWPIPYLANAPRADQTEVSMRLATAAAMLAAKLRGEALGQSVGLESTIKSHRNPT